MRLLLPRAASPSGASPTLPKRRQSFRRKPTSSLWDPVSPGSPLPSLQRRPARGACCFWKRGRLRADTAFIRAEASALFPRGCRGLRAFRIRRSFLPRTPTPTATAAVTLRFSKESERSRNLRSSGLHPWACGSAASLPPEPKPGRDASRATGIPRAEATYSRS